MRILKQQSATQFTIYQKQPQNMEYFNCLGSIITNDARCAREIKSRIAVAKAALKKKFLSAESWT
jgi:hypothetical protein